MLSQNPNPTTMDMIPGKIRKRGCSSSASSSSSVLHNYRFKRTILVGKRGGSSTPVPTWKLMSSRSPLRALASPKYPPSQTGNKPRQAPVSARKLAATLWEMNEIPSPSPSVRSKKELRTRERVPRSMRSGSLPPHLSDPSHSPVSERLDRSGTGSRQKRTPSISQGARITEHHVGPLDSLSNVSLMEIETRSRAQTPASSAVAVKARLKDVSNALMTSKELLRIINRMWGHEDRPSSSMSLISALHTELERARLQVNQLIQEQRSDQNEINYLMKCFAEEKAAWKKKEEEIVEAAIESVAGELDVERKLRRRLESLNKKLGRELADTKTSLLKVVKELESEKRAREIIEQVCDELARDADEDKSDIEKQKRVSTKVCEEVEKEKEIMQLTDRLREERAQKKLSEAKYQLEEKNAAVDKLRNQLEAFLGGKQVREKSRSSTHLSDEEIAAYLSRSRLGSHLIEDKEDDRGEVDNGVECEEESAESDLHSIELNMDNNNKSYKWTYPPESRFDTRRYPIEEEVKGSRRSTSGKASRKSTSLQRSISDGMEWGVQADKIQNSGDGIDWESFYELEKQAQGKGYADEMQGYKSVKGLRDQILAGSRLASSRGYASPTRQFSQPWPSRDLANNFQERPATAQGNGLKSRLGEARGEGQNVRKSKRSIPVCFCYHDGWYDRVRRVQNMCYISITSEFLFSPVAYAEARRLEGKVALITGGASGIGEATARLFLCHGAKVIIADIQDNLGHSLCQNLNSSDNNISYVHCDVTNDNDVQNAVNAAVSRHGKLDILFSNAGTVGRVSPSITAFDNADLKRVFEVNVFGAFYAAKHAAKVMIPEKRGSIVLTSSVASVTHAVSPHAYTASKHAVVGLMKNLCVELGNHGIRVNCVSPYAVATPLMTRGTRMKKEMVEKVYSEAGNLKGVVLKEEDLAEAALFLASDESKYVSGVNLVVDGGYSVTNVSVKEAVRKFSGKPKL
ncbi:hypothetical protein JHK85_008241 [Glycine max]|nr:hypothetical protein JHK85_008241 [Glycine max]KAG5072792.1 hypothetical protein JHK86_008003 [Glycine max]